jgi:hypothetical protein
MEILLPAAAIVVIVMFVFYVFAQHVNRTIRRQSWTIRQLFERVEDLESLTDPLFLRRLNDAAPMPLEQVFTLTFRIDDRFWTEILCAREEVRTFVREFGSFVGSIKLERWRSHTVATITEVLPDRKSIGWQARTLDIYTDGAKACEPVTLWELPLRRASFSAEKPPSLELLLRGNSIELCGHLGPGIEEPNANDSLEDWEDAVFFRVPLDAAQLAGFRSHDPAGANENGNGHSNAGANPNAWQAFYSERNEVLGIEWQLWMRDLSKKSEWERWKILDPAINVAAAKR